MNLTHSNNFSHTNNHKLVNFNVPKYLISNFDNLVKFKRVSRTSMLLQLMENYIRTEKKRMEEDSSLYIMIKEIEKRNLKSLKEEMSDLKTKIEDESGPPSPIVFNSLEQDRIDEYELSKDDWGDPSGLDRFRGL